MAHVWYIVTHRNVGRPPLRSKSPSRRRHHLPIRYKIFQAQGENIQSTMCIHCVQRLGYPGIIKSKLHAMSCLVTFTKGHIHKNRLTRRSNIWNHLEHKEINTFLKDRLYIIIHLSVPMKTLPIPTGRFIYVWHFTLKIHTRYKLNLKTMCITQTKFI